MSASRIPWFVLAAVSAALWAVAFNSCGRGKLAINHRVQQAYSVEGDVEFALLVGTAARCMAKRAVILAFSKMPRTMTLNSQV